MSALPARTSYVHTTTEATHYLVDTEVLGLLDLTLRLPASRGPHPTVLVAYSEAGAGFVEARETARALTAAGFASILFGRDLSRPHRRFRPVGDWRFAATWAAGHHGLRPGFAAWGRDRDAEDVQRLAFRAVEGYRAGIAVLPVRRGGRGRRARRPEPPSAFPILTSPSSGAGSALQPDQLTFLRTHLLR